MKRKELSIPMLNVFIRSLMLYGVVVLVMRIMGKRQIGQLQPFELVVAIMIAELASIPMEDVGVPIIKGIVPIFSLVLAQVTLSYITLKSERARAFICGSPSIIIENGVIQQNELKKQRINLNDLLEQLRSKDVANVEDVEFAILETNGQLSVFPKSDRKPVTPSDLQIATQPEDIPLTLVIDGHINTHNLSKAGLDHSWLEDQLKQQGLKTDDVFFAYLDTQKNFQVIAKQRSG